MLINERNWLSVVMLLLGICVIGLTMPGCSTTGGAKFFCGYEEMNDMKKTTGYSVPKKDK